MGFFADTLEKEMAVRDVQRLGLHALEELDGMKEE